MESVVQAFTAENVERLTGLSAAQLRRWDREGFFAPSHADANGRRPHARVYSFSDVVGLRTLAILRKEHGVSRQHLRAAAHELSLHSAKPWSELTLYVLNGEVHFRKPGTGQVRGAVSGQYAVPIALKSVVEDMRRKADALRERRHERIGRVVRHRLVAHNQPVIGDTRIPVASVLAFEDAGYSVADILREYPSLTEDDVRAALDYRRRLTQAA